MASFARSSILFSTLIHLNRCNNLTHPSTDTHTHSRARTASLFYTPKGFLLHSIPQSAECHRHLPANSSQSPALILTFCSHQSLAWPLHPSAFHYISRCLCSKSPYMSNSDPIRARDQQRRARRTHTHAHTQQSASVCSLSSAMIDSDPV